LIVPRGTVVFKVTNVGKRPHDFKIAGKKTRLLGPRSASPSASPASNPYLCTVPGRAATGMKRVLTVKQPPAGALSFAPRARV
jgi:hypothetical protein